MSVRVVEPRLHAISDAGFPDEAGLHLVRFRLPVSERFVIAEGSRETQFLCSIAVRGKNNDEADAAQCYECAAT